MKNIKEMRTAELETILEDAVKWAFAKDEDFARRAGAYTTMREIEHELQRRNTEPAGFGFADEMFD